MSSSPTFSQDGRALFCFLQGSTAYITHQILDKDSDPNPTIIGTITLSDCESCVAESNASRGKITNEKPEDDRCTCATFSNDARLFAVVSSAKAIHIFLAGADMKYRPYRTIHVEKRGIVTLKFTEDNETLVFVDKAGDVYLEAVKPQKDPGVFIPPKKILGHCSFISDMILLGKDRIITCDRDAKIRISNFPDAFNIDRYCLEHEKAVVGIAPVFYDKFLLSVAVNGECIVWSLLDGKEDGGILNMNLMNVLHCQAGNPKGVVENLRVTTYKRRTIFGVTIVTPTCKIILVYELAFNLEKKGFELLLLQNWTYELNSEDTPLDFVLVGNLAIEFFPSLKLTQRNLSFL